MRKHAVQDGNLAEDKLRPQRIHNDLLRISALRKRLEKKNA
jgi:hypothetical protein